jgi:hypothetical protein
VAMVLENDPPRTRELRADVPPALDDAVAGALTKNPDKRYRDVAEFAQDIAVAMNDGKLLEQAQRIRRIVSRGTDELTGSQQVSSGTGTLARSHIRTRPDEGRNRKLLLGAAALAALLLAGGLGAYFASSNNPTPAVEASPTAAPMEVPLPTVPAGGGGGRGRAARAARGARRSHTARGRRERRSHRRRRPRTRTDDASHPLVVFVAQQQPHQQLQSSGDGRAGRDDGRDTAAAADHEHAEPVAGPQLRSRARAARGRGDAEPARAAARVR